MVPNTVKRHCIASLPKTQHVGATRGAFNINFAYIKHFILQIANFSGSSVRCIDHERFGLSQGLLKSSNKEKVIQLIVLSLDNLEILNSIANKAKTWVLHFFRHSYQPNQRDIRLSFLHKLPISCKICVSIIEGEICLKISDRTVE